LGAAVAEERLPADAAALAERLRQQALRLGVPGVRDVDELPDLLAHRLDDARRAVAEAVAAPAGEEVEVAVPLRVPDARPLAAHQADRVTGVIADHVLLEQVDDFRRGTGRCAHGRNLCRLRLGNWGNRPRRGYCWPSVISVPTPRSV